MAEPFWVLEDPRCRSWSPTPQYLHKDAAFYRTGKWGKLGGGNELFTPDIHLARRFADRAAAEAFREASPDLKSWAYEACEHAMIGA